MSKATTNPISMTSLAIDLRADGARRAVNVSATQVTIERVLHGVKMRIAVPTPAYRSLVLAVRLPSGNATLTLRHEDRDLDVILADGDALELARTARDWSAAIDRPIIVEKAFIAIAAPILRRTTRCEPSRRSRFARRRKIGLVARLDTSFAHEDEIIART